MQQSEFRYDFDESLLSGLREAQENLDSLATASRYQLRTRTIWVVPLATTAAVAAAIVAVVITQKSVVPLPPGSSPPTTTAGVRSTPSLQEDILAAFHKSAPDVLHIQQVTSVNGTVITQDLWQSALEPLPGSTVRLRSTVVVNRTPNQDVEMIWREPLSGADTAPGDSGAVTGQEIDVDYGSHSWTDQKSTSITPGLPGGPEQIRQQVAADDLAVIGETNLGGKSAIELSSAGHQKGVSLTVWVDPSTYRPIKSVDEYTTGVPGAMTTGTITDEYHFLAPTSANLAHLDVPIPTGFTQDAAPTATSHG